MDMINKAVISHRKTTCFANWVTETFIALPTTVEKRLATVERGIASVERVISTVERGIAITFFDEGKGCINMMGITMCEKAGGIVDEKK